MTGFGLKYKTKPRTTCTGIGAFVAGLVGYKADCIRVSLIAKLKSTRLVPRTKCLIRELLSFPIEAKSRRKKPADRAITLKTFITKFPLLIQTSVVVY